MGIKELRDEFIFNSLKELLTQGNAKQLYGDVLRIIKEEITVESKTEYYYSTTIFLIKELLCKDALKISDLTQLKGILNINENKIIKDLHVLIKNLETTITEDELDKLKQLLHEESIELDIPFGALIKFNNRCYNDEIFQVTDSENSDKEDKTIHFSIKYESEVSDQAYNHNVKNLVDKIEQIQKLKSNIEFLDHKEMLLNILLTASSTVVMQNELLDLFGLEQCHLIENILELKEQLLEFLLDKKDNIFLAKKHSQPAKLLSTPLLASQVTIQSGFEKQMKKQIQKDNKKMLKNKEKGKENLYNAEVGSYFQTTINEKLTILEDASHQPLFHLSSNQDEISGTSQEKLPFVWDSLAEAKQTASFIAGNKMSLPEGCKRLQNKIYEEIVVPADKRDKSFDDLRIPIESLDWIGKTAFAGTKSLNPIQSIVFPAAYNTNQNLLICAPTGAGKTNVALLTILNLLKRYSDPLDDVSSVRPQENLVNEQEALNDGQNIPLSETTSDGPCVIRRDDFKIVYVAPMKALASEMVANFSKKLAPFKIQVRELTGDMQLTKREIADTQMIITTPEKWDVITRKNTGDVALTQAVKLLIIDEVHLLQDTRGAVIEAIVARTLRQVETMQSMIRIVGLSATLPSYLHVAKFLRVNPRTGLFFFDGRFRPVPLSQTFIGVKSHKIFDQRQDMDQICFDQVIKQLSQNHQVMVFVHARNATVRSATKLRDTASQTGKLHLFTGKDSNNSQNNESKSRGGARGQAQYHMNASCRDKRLKELFEAGLGFHHAGLLRSDRNLVEKYFAEGHIRVLVCTSTLAWGVNLPAHCVLIKGTEIYDSQAGGFKNLGVLDVAQIFGRAGRPQFDSLGEAILITAHDQLTFYLASLVKRSPVESRFTESLPDALNAEIVLGSVSRLSEAVEWLAYTYLHVRMRANPLAYGISYRQLQLDPDLSVHEMSLIKAAVTELDRARMVRFDPANGYLHSTDIGRVASHYYVNHATVQLFNRHLGDAVTEAHTLALVSASQEFTQIKLREEELEELEALVSRACPLPVILIDGPTQSPLANANPSSSSLSSLRGTGDGILEAAQSSKVNVLIQAYVSRERLTSFSLTSDTNYINQNVSRIIRALFEMVLYKGWPLAAGRLLNLAKIVDLRVWSFESPLKQFEILSQEILDKLEDKRLTIERLREMEAKEIGHMVHHVRMGGQIKQLASNFPMLLMEATLQPITRSILRIRLTITPDFVWNDKVHGSSSGISWWIWIEDPDNNHIYHTEYFTLNKRAVIRCEPQTLVFTIPIFEPLPGQYYVRAISDHWIGPENVLALSFKHLILPALHPPQTDLLDLNPLPITALNDTRLELLYPYTHFNPIQTQVFHCLYHTDHNAMIGAPTGSGKTVTAEIAIFRLWREYPGHKAVYIAPLKALVKERVKDWTDRIEGRLGRKIVELTGDSSPDARSILAADLIICTPEKWDGISRSWQTRNYVKLVTLIIIDEIHMLGNDRGPVLEAIVSRTNYIASHTGKRVRVIGLSTALANPNDLANWLGIKDMGLYNFRPSVRPVPLEAHISGFPGKHYCPRMAAMNKPTYQAIRTYSPDKPTIIFVSSRRQTRLTALDLIAYLALEDNPKQWLKMADDEIENIVTTVKDNNLAHFLLFGIGMHHAGLHERDRKIVEELFVNLKIQVLIATSTLAWGVNFPAHLVVIKGTEYYDGKTHKYVDFPITDVLQMMGRAGRPQYDDKGVAVILVQDSKKHFYKKFLYEPFPVESSLLEVLPDHLNAEIVGETIQNKQEALDYLTWTYFFRRLWQNPSFYGLDDIEHLSVNAYLSALVEKTIVELESSYCVVVEEDNRTITPTTLGRIASFYYLTHGSVKVFKDKLAPYLNLESVINVLSLAREFSELPVRHNEDGLNAELADLVPFKVDPYTYDSPYTKANLLLQCHFGRTKLPSSDYYTDTKSVLDQVLRILQALLDMTAEQGWLATSIIVINLMQMCAQARWIHDSSLLTLPHLNSSHLELFKNVKQKERVVTINSLPELVLYCQDQRSNLVHLLKDHFSQSKIDEIFSALIRYPMIKVGLKLIDDQPAQRQRNDIIINIERQKRPPVESWPSIKADLEYTLSIRLFRLNNSRKRGSKAFCPKFPKEKDESWILILADMEKRELLALKRIGCVFEQTNTSITFNAPDKIGPFIYTFYLMSDAYLGLDQQYEICVNVI